MKERILDYLKIFALVVIILILSKLFTETFCTNETAFTESYTINNYNVAGTEDYIWVVDFQFNTPEEAWRFIKKIELQRRR